MLQPFHQVHSEFGEGRSGNEEKSLTFHSFPPINDTISVSFFVFVCFLLQKSVLQRSEIEEPLI